MQADGWHRDAHVQGAAGAVGGPACRFEEAGGGRVLFEYPGAGGVEAVLGHRCGGGVQEPAAVAVAPLVLGDAQLVELGVGAGPQARIGGRAERGEPGDHAITRRVRGDRHEHAVPGCRRAGQRGCPVVPPPPYGILTGYVRENRVRHETLVPGSPPADLDAGQIRGVARPGVLDPVQESAGPSRLMSRAAPVEAEVASAAKSCSAGLTGRRRSRGREEPSSALIVSALARSSASGTARVSSRRGMSISTLSPSWTSAIGPPKAASGAAWQTDRPEVPPENRPSVIRAQARPRPRPLR